MTVTQARRHQDEWATYLKVPVEYTNSIGMKFWLIPPGEFTMGSTAAEIEEAVKVLDASWKSPIESEGPAHKVILTQPTYIGIYEVTQAEYAKVMGTNPSHFSPTGDENASVAGMETSSFPVEWVSWKDAAEFCAKLSMQEKMKPFYLRDGDTITQLNGTGYRLPTEAEWEFACRSGTTKQFWIGDQNDDLLRVGWSSANSGVRTHAVGELKANPFGLFDVLGNVWEWVHDDWEQKYYREFAQTPAINPRGPSSGDQFRMIRGGSWYRPEVNCRASSRFSHDPAADNVDIGFRVSLTVATVKQASLTKTANIDGLEFKEWMKDVQVMSADKQTKAVTKKLRELNPEFDGALTPRIENGKVVGLNLSTDHVTDISPLRALTGLHDLDCS